jgi:hypothetical protein
MSGNDDLPPTPRTRLSAWGWASVAASLILGAALSLTHPGLAWIYLTVVAVGFLVGIPGGMQYQVEVDLYFSKNPGMTNDALPFPSHYGALSKDQARRYVWRGIAGAIAYGVMAPTFLLLGVLVSLRLLKEDVLERLYREEET